MSLSPRTALTATLLALLTGPALMAQTSTVQDIQPVNAPQMLQDLKLVGSKQASNLAALKSQAYQAALQLVNSPGNAQTAWETAIQVTQFQGLPNDAVLFHEWKEKTSDVRKSAETTVALHLYFNWLTLTLQHSMGVETKDLLPAIMAHAKEALAYQAFMDQMDDTIRHEMDAIKEASTPKDPLHGGAGGKGVPVHDRDKLQEAEAFKKYHADIANTSLGGSAYVQWQHLEDVVNDVAPIKKKGEKADTSQSDSSWSPIPADIDGLYANIILPELRARGDVHAIEYWDQRLRREADIATKSKLQFQIDQFNTEARPLLLWSRAEEFEWIGMKNRAATEMFNVIKTSPPSPNTAQWVLELQKLLAPTKPTSGPTPPDGSAGVAPPPLPGAK